MRIQKTPPAAAVEPTLLLSQVSSGEVVRFATDTFEDALKTEAFYMKIDAPELKDSVMLLNIKDGKRITRDGSHRVVKHDAIISISQ